MASGHGVLVAHLLLLLLTASISFAPTLANLMVVANEGRGVTAMKPMVAPGQGWMVYNETRRRLGSFQICALCTCCGGPKGLCIPSPCCYSINCNIPNRPFGYCSFIPKTCNCLGCHL
ncbi:hypothetical protein J5N97_019825 [Dioscorea zingiberensis]|uniref:DUF7866 domain-containing protein n=1 Tax=Dioscorea zingiberensis TaxID=325984 RepID=A0A9D5HCN4_9LILI|nr:hypothetical protein J5N97_019825 [Dioscorea zingiberensis]